MNDQATTLRHLAAVPPAASTTVVDDLAGSAPPIPGSKVRTIAITGGKGGVGKSNIAVNLAIELAALGKHVTLLDADLGLANTDVLLGCNPKFHLGHVLSGQRMLEEIVVELDSGVRLLPGGSGIEELANLSQATHARFIAELRAMEARADYMLVDTAAGIGENVTGVLRAASEVIVVTTPDPTAVVDAYATIKVLHQHAPQKPIAIIVNNVIGSGDADRVFAHLFEASQRFLTHHIEYLGSVPRDPELVVAVREQTPVVEFAPGASSSRAIRLIAKLLEQQGSAAAAPDTDFSFWKQLAESEV